MGVDGWTAVLESSPLDWLLESGDPTVRAMTLEQLLGRRTEHDEVASARSAAMLVDPIAGILAAQDDEGWWAKPGPGYAPKYSGTVWNLIFLAQLGADPADPRVQRACEHVLTYTATSSGGFGCSSAPAERPAPPSSVLHCLNGNLVHTLIRFGHLEHPAVRAATDWTARHLLGEHVDRWYAYTPSPGFACRYNDGQPCAWGAIKALRGLAAVPEPARTDRERRAIDAGLEFLFSTDPARADYPMGYGRTKPSSSWFKLGFPSGYVTDVLQNLEVLSALGQAHDRRLDHAFEWLIGLADHDGRWTNRYAYAGKTTVPIDAHGKPSKWVTLRACTVLRARYGETMAASSS
jgi:hypothetical protein